MTCLATLVYSELSHYFTASQGHCQACFVGHPEGCTADPAVYSMDDTLVERNDASRSKSTTDRTKATKHRLDRARDLLREGQNRGRGEAAADWVLIYLSDVEGCGRRPRAAHWRPCGSWTERCAPRAR